MKAMEKRLTWMFLWIVSALILALPVAAAQWEFINPIPTSVSLSCVWGSSPTDVYAVGTTGIFCILTA